MASSSIVSWKCFCFSQHFSVNEKLKTKLIAIKCFRCLSNNRKCHSFRFLQLFTSKCATQMTFEAFEICMTACSGFFLNYQLKMFFFVFVSVSFYQHETKLIAINFLRLCINGKCKFIRLHHLCTSKWATQKNVQAFEKIWL